MSQDDKVFNKASSKLIKPCVAPHVDPRHHLSYCSYRGYSRLLCLWWGGHQSTVTSDL